MKHFILLLALLLPYISYAASGSGNVANVQIMGVTKTAPQGMGSVGLRDVHGGVGGVFSMSISTNDGITANNVTPFYRDGDIYQVPALTSTYCTGSYTGDTGITYCQFMSGTATYNHNTAVGSVTGIKYQNHASNVGTYRVYNTLNEYTPMQGFYRFRAGTWPGVQVQAATGLFVILNCYEKLD